MDLVIHQEEPVTRMAPKLDSDPLARLPRYADRRISKKRIENSQPMFADNIIIFQ